MLFHQLNVLFYPKNRLHSLKVLVRECVYEPGLEQTEAMAC